METKEPINIYYSQKGTPYVWASALHQELEIGTKLSTWFPRMIDYGFIENEDFSSHTKNVPTTNGMEKTKNDWAVRLDMAKHIAMLQRTEKGKIIRQQLIDLDKKINTGNFISKQQLTAMFDICNVLGYFSIQKYAERKHFDFFNNKNEWWQYRAKIMGVTAKDLKELVEGIGKKYTSQRQSLMKIDKFELVKVCMIDLLMALGRTEEYAKNMADFAKQIAERTNPQIYNDIGMTLDFKSPNEKEIIGKIKDSRSSLLLGQF